MARAVPYAATPDGGLVLPADAVAGQPYVCLQCGEPVSFRRAHLRAGKGVEAHFSHRPGSACAGESVTHLAAKWRLHDALSRRERPFVLRRHCARLWCEATLDQPWDAEPYDVACTEVPLGPYRLDVAALQGERVVTGYEIFHSHRVSTAKAAGLPVPWIELQAKATVEDPYVLQPVLEAQLSAAAHATLRVRLRASRVNVPATLNHRMRAGELLIEPGNPRMLPMQLIEPLFHSHLEQASGLEPWHCPTCEAAWTRHALLVLEFARRAREQALRNEQYQREQAAAAEVELARQREVFGPRLKTAFHQHEVVFFERLASTMRFAWRYVPYPEQLAEHFQACPEELLIARRCGSCHRPILCVDTNQRLGRAQGYFPMIALQRLDGRAHGVLVSVCLHCGARQRFLGQYEGTHVRLWAHQLLRWREAFED
ncbi:competence protein CoiA family protein [Deinococcus humi]|uniref:Competence protein CoiA n=1 Tax=Deinococcus humi TaxID=662880 RepID=A0A7W8K2H3_9DEIO|nr:competence protein CoiA family protein [Deinococcus humi]MBB5366311.1 hypothetical protein [Deinococcus humi]GGO33595.1 hypothetical protein GCM10008949_33030 [Deinococcus humi]